MSRVSLADDLEHSGYSGHYYVHRFYSQSNSLLLSQHIPWEEAYSIRSISAEVVIDPFDIKTGEPKGQPRTIHISECIYDHRASDEIVARIEACQREDES